MINHAAVLIPARDESDRIERCLRSVIAAKQHCSVDVMITVVADGCLDDTAAVARSVQGVQVVEIESSNVGTARRTAALHALHSLDLPPKDIWLANTDADSVVPENWLTAQIGYADSGYDVVIGTVRPDPRESPEELQRKWEETHIKGQPNGHVHGANLGFRASAYLSIGGYRRLPEHEDVDLVTRLAGHSQVASSDAEVITSARLRGQTPGGYAGYLRNMMRRPLTPRSMTGSAGAFYQTSSKGVSLRPLEEDDPSPIH